MRVEKKALLATRNSYGKEGLNHPKNTKKNKRQDFVCGLGESFGGGLGENYFTQLTTNFFALTKIQSV